MNKNLLKGVRDLKKGYRSFIKETQKKNPNVRRDIARNLVRIAAADLKLLGTIEDIIKSNEEYEKNHKEDLDE
jgi:hypothetical protein